GGGAQAVADGSDVYALAREVGRLVAQRGAIVLTGGGAGVMAGAAIGATEGGGHSIGILPNGQYSREGWDTRRLASLMGVLERLLSSARLYHLTEGSPRRGVRDVGDPSPDRR